MLKVFSGIQSVRINLSRRTTLMICIASLVINLLALSFPITLLQIYDRVIPNDATDTLALLTLICCLAFCTDFILKSARNNLMLHFESQWSYQQSCHLLQRLVGCVLNNFQSETTSWHINALHQANESTTNTQSQLLILLMDLPFVLLFISIIGYIAPVSLIILIPGCCIALAYLVSNYKHTHKQSTKKLAHSQDKTNFIYDMLQQLQAAKSLGIEESLLRRYESLQRKALPAELSYNQLVAKQIRICRFIASASLSAIVCYCTWLAIQTQFTIGALAATTLLTSRVFEPITRLAQVFQKLQAIESAQAIIKEIETLPQEEDDNYVSIEKIHGHIQLDRISITTAQDMPATITEFSENFAPGEITLLSHANPTYITTILHLLAGLHAPTVGSVWIDGHDMYHLNLPSYRKHIALINASGELFAGTLLENLTLFQMQQRTAKVKALVSLFGLNKQVERLPQGYFTPVGQSSVENLSRGMKQMVLIIRQLAADPKIILFNDGNTALDPQANQILRQYLLDHKKSKTIIIGSSDSKFQQIADRTIYLNSRNSTQQKQEVA